MDSLAECPECHEDLGANDPHQPGCSRNDVTERLVEVDPPKELTIVVVPDTVLSCPGCGAYWGHPDPALDFPNRFKVDSWARCYNPACKIGLYNPFTGESEKED